MFLFVADETKALIKANREKENAGQLPSFLRNSANAQRNVGNEFSGADGDVPPVTPMATQAAINDDISSMSGVSSPAEGQENVVNVGVLKQISVSKIGNASFRKVENPVTRILTISYLCVVIILIINQLILSVHFHQAGSRNCPTFNFTSNEC